MIISYRSAALAPLIGSVLAILVTAFQPTIDPAWYLAAFMLLLLVYWRTDKSRVPLYLTNATAAKTIATLLPASPCHFIDLGCGEGGLIKRLAHARPDCEFLGIEHAPLPWLVARLTAGKLPNCHIRFGSFWKHPLASYDVVYAFLSPVPMPSLQTRTTIEMRPGTLFISNSFPFPDRPPDKIIEVKDSRHTQLYCYTNAK